MRDIELAQLEVIAGQKSIKQFSVHYLKKFDYRILQMTNQKYSKKKHNITV